MGVYMVVSCSAYRSCCFNNKKVTSLKNIPKDLPIFASKNRKIVGMVVFQGGRWYLSLKPDFSPMAYPYTAYGVFSTREKCIDHGVKLGYDFFIGD